MAKAYIRLYSQRDYYDDPKIDVSHYEGWSTVLYPLGPLWRSCAISNLPLPTVMTDNPGCICRIHLQEFELSYRRKQRHLLTEVNVIKVIGFTLHTIFPNNKEFVCWIFPSGFLIIFGICKVVTYFLKHSTSFSECFV